MLSLEDFKTHPFSSRFCNTLVVSKVFENRVLRRKFGLKTDEVTGEWRNYIMRSIIICIPHPL